MISDYRISTYFHSIQDLKDLLSYLFQQSFKYGKEHIDAVLGKDVQLTIDALKDDLFVWVELPYVDKMYRDTFYHYYASRQKNYERNCIRISLFSKKIDVLRVNEERGKEVESAYLGFFIIRPTMPRLIGRSAISPRALKNSNFISCVSPIPSTALGFKLKVNAFPHASQDGQAISCAETTIWSLMEYFGNRYAEYNPLLPSAIMKRLQRFSYKRQIPSDGLTAEQIAFVIREVGFGTMIYSNKKPDSFSIALSMIIESGIPVVGVLKSEKLGHAVNVVGRECDDRKAFLAASAFIKDSGDLILYDFHQGNRNYVIIDDNRPPYQLASLQNPCNYYNDASWDECRLQSIIVPLYSKIYLDPIRARKNFLVVIQSSMLKLSHEEPHVIRMFLASSRSYKAYIANNEGLNQDLKSIILSLAMPKFVWVAELSSGEKFQTNQIVGLLLQDATDPAEYSHSSVFQEISVFFGLSYGKYFTILGSDIEHGETEYQPFAEYSGNLS